MKYLIFVMLVYIPTMFAQVVPFTCSIDSAGTEADSVELGSDDKLVGVEFPATMTGDTLFVQTKVNATGTWKDVYYIGATGTKYRAHIVVQASAYVGIHPDIVSAVLKYMRFISNSAEGDSRDLITYIKDE